MDCPLARAVRFIVLCSVLAPGLARSGELWMSPREIAALPTAGAAWRALQARAGQPLERPNLADKDSPANTRLVAKALVAIRTGDAELRQEVLDGLEAVQGTEDGANALAVCRELAGFVIAADLVDLDAARRARFSDWLRQLRHRRFGGETLADIHERRPNNWGTLAGASRLSVALYLGDQREIDRTVYVFRGWLGEPDGYTGFRFGAAHWQPEGGPALGINPPGAVRDGHSIAGVLPDDQRRAGPFRWPPPRENYVYEALQGAVVQAYLLSRIDIDAWRWGERAILRAFHWLHDAAGYPAQGDDTWQPYLVNWAYCADFPTTVPASPGKAVGYTDWTHPAGTCRRP